MINICKLIVVFIGILIVLSLLSEKKTKKNNNNYYQIIKELPKYYFIEGTNYSGSSVKNKIFVKNNKKLKLKNPLLIPNNEKKNKNISPDILYPNYINSSINNLKNNKFIVKDEKLKILKNNLNTDKLILPNKNLTSKKRFVKMTNDNEKYDNINKILKKNNSKKIEIKNNNKALENNSNKDKTKIKPISSYSHLQKVTPNSPIHHHNVCSHMKYKF